MRMGQGIRTGLGHGGITCVLQTQFSSFILKMIYCVYSLESPHRGDSNEYTQYTFLFKKIEKISLLCLLTWC